MVLGGLGLKKSGIGHYTVETCSVFRIIIINNQLVPRTNIENVSVTSKRSKNQCLMVWGCINVSNGWVQKYLNNEFVFPFYTLPQGITKCDLSVDFQL